MSDIWWSRRWLEAMGADLSGLEKAARETVFFEIEPGVLKCKIPEPRGGFCFVKMETAVISSEVWNQGLAAMRRSAVFRAKLLSGQMPDSVETLFREQGTAFFPARGDCRMLCSRHRDEKDCAHLEAVLTEFARRFEKDPFLLFAFRGMSREALLKNLDDTVSGKTGMGGGERRGALPSGTPPDFWRARGDLNGLADRLVSALEPRPPMLKIPGLEASETRELEEVLWPKLREEAMTWRIRGTSSCITPPSRP